MNRRGEDERDGNSGIAQPKPKTRRQECGFSDHDGVSVDLGYPEDGQSAQNASAGLKTRNSGKGWFSKPLAVACERLNIDDGPLGESVIQRVDAGAEEPEAVRMALVEYLQRRGVYHGPLKQLVDSGLVFQMRADD